jgi:hypothetical protein
MHPVDQIAKVAWVHGINVSASLMCLQTENI